MTLVLILLITYVGLLVLGVVKNRKESERVKLKIITCSQCKITYNASITGRCPACLKGDSK